MANAKGRIAYFNTHFWRDTYIGTLDPSEKLGYTYLITNPETNICGIYELPLRLMASDTGFKEEMCVMLFDRYSRDKRAYYVDGWVIMINTVKHQNLNNEKIISAINREFSLVPPNIVKKMYESSIPYPYLMDRQLHFTTPHFTTPHLTDKGHSLKEKQQLFSQFWAAYPKKVGKQVAERWWMRKNITKEQLVQMLQSIEAHALSDQWKKGYIPNPLTFLNQGRYEDEVDTTASSKEFKSYIK